VHKRRKPTRMPTRLKVVIPLPQFITYLQDTSGRFPHLGVQWLLDHFTFDDNQATYVPREMQPVMQLAARWWWLVSKS
jgi:hypothetical protein